jgi:hypothetical protein
MPKIQTRINLTDNHLRWLHEMESVGIDRSALIALALDILIPRLDNINTTHKSIISEALNRKAEYNLSQTLIEDLPY